LARAYNKFSEYQLAKWNKDKDIKLRDVVFLTHAKPKDKEQGELIAKLVNKDHVPVATKSGFKVANKYRSLAKNFVGLETPTLGKSLCLVVRIRRERSPVCSKRARWVRSLF